jgi:phosphoglycolate phosphatase-like HAD superfamily hydrolase
MKRVILFDIDGTLVRGGPAKEAFHGAMLETYGTAGDVDGVSFAGKTDLQIARELLLGVGFDTARIEDGFPDLWHRYTTSLQERLVDEPVTVLAGVSELLDALAGIDDVGVALLTGNIARGAELKLGSGGLMRHFSFGSYGSDHEERDELPAIALDRARAEWGSSIRAQDAVVVGDTPRDVQCGQHGGTRTLGVATGSFSASQLRDAGADSVVEDLSDTADVVSFLTL